MRAAASPTMGLVRFPFISLVLLHTFPGYNALEALRLLLPAPAKPLRAAIAPLVRAPRFTARCRHHLESFPGSVKSFPVLFYVQSRPGVYLYTTLPSALSVNGANVPN
jgi:hypothetical protein